MRLKIIPNYADYRRDVIFRAYKWDPQFLDSNTVSPFALVISRAECDELMRLTNGLTAETIAAENAIKNGLVSGGKLKLKRKIMRKLRDCDYDDGRNIRLMRFDFHPVLGGGWAISEVNSDVPGGFAESSAMAQIARSYIGGDRLSFVDFGTNLVDAFKAKAAKNGRIGLIHCSSYSDDRQVMEFLGDKLIGEGFSVVYLAADQIKFLHKKAHCILSGEEGVLDGFLRFTPLEWLMGQKNSAGYFDVEAVCCNHPIAMIAQTKRFPLIFDGLERAGIDMSNWRALLPQTLPLKPFAPLKKLHQNGYILKPVYGRVGENISIKSAISGDEYRKILQKGRLRPDKFVVQKLFNSLPLDGKYHVCIGSYSVDGAAAGFYARINSSARIDSLAADIPVLIEE